MGDGPNAVTRRGVLAVALAPAVLASGCRPFVDAAEDEERDPDIVTVKHALAAEEDLLAAYAAASQRHPRLRESLAPFVHRHRKHRATLRARLPKRATASPSGSSGETSSPSPSRPAPRSPKRALAELVGAEHAAAAGRIDDAIGASTTLAEVLASIGACESAHAKLLHQVRP